MTKKVNIIKVPLSAKSRKEYPKAFPRMPILYLELIENKAKIKQELINIDHVPSSRRGSPSTEEHRIPESVRASPSPSNSASDSEAEVNIQSFKPAPHSFEKYETKTVEKYEDDKIRGSEKREDKKPRYDTDSDDDDIKRRKPSRKESSGSSAGSERGKKDTISNRLRELLNDDEEPERAPIEKVEKSEPFASAENPPSLNDLARSGQINRKKEIMDVSHVTMSEQEKEDSKRELLFKFELLKKSYKSDNIPEFSIHSDYDSMKRTYETTVRTLSLDRSVDDYKKYLSYAFIGMEFVLGYFFKLDMNGFARQQMISMSSYERLLIELGEKSYVPTGSKWPVEVRLLFLVIMNTAVFLVGRMMLKKTGADVMGLVNSVTGTVPSNPIPQKKRKMKGPTLNPDDIPDINQTET